MKPGQPSRLTRMAPRSIPSIPLMRVPINALAFLIVSWAFTGVVLTADPQPPATNAISHLARLTPLKSPDGQYRLAMGDRVSYRVIEGKDEAKSLVVTDSGELDVPYLGRVKAVDKTCKQLGREGKGRLEKDPNYHATA